MKSCPQCESVFEIEDMEFCPIDGIRLVSGTSQATLHFEAPSTGASAESQSPRVAAAAAEPFPSSAASKPKGSDKGVTFDSAGYKLLYKPLYTILIIFGVAFVLFLIFGGPSRSFEDEFQNRPDFPFRRW